ncbi:MAG: Mth938-like domain-containing protein [Gammaproteobacteria bacterium]|nr:Mth938-like domain-containing protein [Gammaproteobacteria bacterium]
MKLHAERGSGNYIQSVTSEAVLINGTSYTGHVIVSADRIVTGWTPRPIAELQLEDFAAALDLEPEVILFGTGSTHRFAGNRLMTAIMSRGIGFEVMATRAACRTYNVLTAEDRRVVAALLLGP